MVDHITQHPEDWSGNRSKTIKKALMIIIIRLGPPISLKNGFIFLVITNNFFYNIIIIYFSIIKY